MYRKGDKVRHKDPKRKIGTLTARDAYGGVDEGEVSGDPFVLGFVLVRWAGYPYNSPTDHHSMPDVALVPWYVNIPFTINEGSNASGCICKRCNQKNDYAVPNQPDGKYLCYECR